MRPPPSTMTPIASNRITSAYGRSRRSVSQLAPILRTRACLSGPTASSGQPARPARPPSLDLAERQCRADLDVVGAQRVR